MLHGTQSEVFSRFPLGRSVVIFLCFLAYVYFMQLSPSGKGAGHFLRHQQSMSSALST